MLDSISDTLLNAFSRVRKPDERFLAMREGVDKFEEGIVVSERLWNRVRSRTNGEYMFLSFAPPCVVCPYGCLRLNEMAAPNRVKT